MTEERGDALAEFVAALLRQQAKRQGMVFAQDMVFNILTGLMGWRRAKAKALVTLAMEMVKKEGG